MLGRKAIFRCVHVSLGSLIPIAVVVGVAVEPGGQGHGLDGGGAGRSGLRIRVAVHVGLGRADVHVFRRTGVRGTSIQTWEEEGEKNQGIKLRATTVERLKVLKSAFFTHQSPVSFVVRGREASAPTG